MCQVSSLLKIAIITLHFFFLSWVYYLTDLRLLRFQTDHDLFNYKNTSTYAATVGSSHVY